MVAMLQAEFQAFKMKMDTLQTNLVQVHLTPATSNMTLVVEVSCLCPLPGVALTVSPLDIGT